MCNDNKCEYEGVDVQGDFVPSAAEYYKGWLIPAGMSETQVTRTKRAVDELLGHVKAGWLKPFPVDKEV